MVRATIIVSALVAMVASVAAVPRPHGGLVGDVNADGALSDNLRDIEVSDNLNDNLNFDDVDVLSYILKREEAGASQTVRIAKTHNNGNKPNGNGNGNGMRNDVSAGNNPNGNRNPIGNDESAGNSA